MLLEIVAQLFREQSAETLFSVVAETQRQEQMQREQRLRELKEAELSKTFAETQCVRSRPLLPHVSCALWAGLTPDFAARGCPYRKLRGARHSRFGTTFEVAALGDQSHRKSLGSALNLRTPGAINESGKAHKAKRVLADVDAATSNRHSPLDVRGILYRTACSFVTEAYNWIMPAVASELERYRDSVGAQAEVLHYDRSNYLRIMRLCMELHRLQLEQESRSNKGQPATVGCCSCPGMHWPYCTSLIALRAGPGPGQGQGQGPDPPGFSMDVVA